MGADRRATGGREDQRDALKIESQDFLAIPRMCLYLAMNSSISAPRLSMVQKSDQP